VKFWILKHEYGYEEEVLMTRWTLHVGPDNWALMEESETKDLVAKKLWIKKNFDEWVRDQRRAYYVSKKKY
jgi:hypothetical protein